MQSAILATWLGLASAAAAEPNTIQIESHSLANTTSQKLGSPGRQLVPRATHEMSAVLDASGKLEYSCDAAEHAHSSEAVTSSVHEEH